MSRIGVVQCDGPTCLETAEDVFDDDDAVTAGWFLVTFQAEASDEDEVEERVAHLHSYECLVGWAQESAREAEL